MATSTETLISTSTLNTSASSITLSSIPQTYSDLRLVVVESSTGSNYASYVRLNNDSTGSNYAQTYFYATSSVSQSGMLSTTGIQADVVGGMGTTYQHSYIMDIIGYSGSKWKTSLIKALASEPTGGSSSLIVGLWRSTSAVTSIVLVPDGGASFASGTTVALYGIL